MTIRSNTTAADLAEGTHQDHPEHSVETHQGEAGRDPEDQPQHSHSLEDARTIAGPYTDLSQPWKPSIGWIKGFVAAHRLLALTILAPSPKQAKMVHTRIFDTIIYEINRDAKVLTEYERGFIAALVWSWDAIEEPGSDPVPSVAGEALRKLLRPEEASRDALARHLNYNEFAT